MSQDLNSGHITENQSMTNDNPGILSILINVFANPVKAYQDLNLRKSVWKPMLVALIILIVIMAITGAVSAPHSARDQYNILQQSTILPPQVLEDARSGIENPNYISGAIGGPIFVLIMAIVSCLIAWAVCSFIFGGEARFGRIWAVYILGTMIGTLGALLKLPLIIAKQTAMVSYGLAALMPGGGVPTITGLFFLFVDAFMIWSMIVIGIGYSEIFNISRGKGITAAVIGDIVVIMMLITLQVVGLSFAGLEISFF